jgi:mitochondrial import inner membrane translocase subunit TIM8
MQPSTPRHGAFSYTINIDWSCNHAISWTPLEAADGELQWQQQQQRKRQGRGAMAGVDKGPSRELQAFIEREQQLAQVQQMVATLTETCFEKCVSSPGSYLSSRETSCIENCAKRFIDATQYILQRAAHKAEGAGPSF